MEYEFLLQGLSGRIDGLRRERKAFVLAVLARSLSPLLEGGSFTESVLATAVRPAIDAVSRAAAGFAVGDNRHLIEALAQAVPPADDLSGGMREYYAQDALVIIHAALQAAFDGAHVGGMVVEYALSPMRQYLCERDFGVLDIGSSPEEIAWESQLYADPLINKAIRFIESSIDRAEDDEPIRFDEVAAISAQGDVLLPPGTAVGNSTVLPVR